VELSVIVENMDTNKKYSVTKKVVTQKEIVLEISLCQLQYPFEPGKITLISTESLIQSGST
jgi:hypothetical protein